MALILQEYTVKNPIFVFLTSLTDFSDHLLSASASCYFSNILWLFILFHLFGDPKMGYNSVDDSGMMVQCRFKGAWQ
jgi:hypothetical protein